MKEIWFMFSKKITIKIKIPSDRDILDLLLYSHYNNAIMEEALHHPKINVEDQIKNIHGLELKLFKAHLVKRGAYKIYLDNLAYFRDGR